jgi:uncharacterized damage-inducible protein DinB
MGGIARTQTSNGHSERLPARRDESKNLHLLFVAAHQPIHFPKEEIIMPVAEQIAINSIAESFLAEFEAQAPATRRFLERLPEDKLTWKPHHKSMTAGQLALHIATTTAGVIGLVQDNPRQARSEFVFPQPASRDEILKAFDESVATVRRELPKFDDAAMHESWRLVAGDKELFAVPRMGFLRDAMLSHWYQHRGQFSVYLRILNVAVPATWGPSADEVPAFMQQAEKVA